MMVTEGVAETVTACVYVPAFTVTVGIPCLWAYAMASPIAVNCPELSVATTTTEDEAGGKQ